jgi:hypothetical protein
VSTVQRDQLVTQEVLARGNVFRDGHVREAVRVLNPILGPKALAPWEMVVASLVGGLAGIKPLLVDLEELGVGWVVAGAGTIATSKVGNDGTLGMRPLLAVHTTVATPANTDDAPGWDFWGHRAPCVTSRRASNVTRRRCEKTRCSQVKRTYGVLTLLYQTKPLSEGMPRTGDFLLSGES